MTSPFQKMLKDWQSKKARQAINRHTRLLINIDYLLFKFEFLTAVCVCTVSGPNSGQKWHVLLYITKVVRAVCSEVI